MIRGELVTVWPEFDSGKYTGKFIVIDSGNSYQLRCGTNDIQNLSKEDFVNLSLIICEVVQAYLRHRGKPKKCNVKGCNEGLILSKGQWVCPVHDMQADEVE